MLAQLDPTALAKEIATSANWERYLFVAMFLAVMGAMAWYVKRTLARQDDSDKLNRASQDKRDDATIKSQDRKDSVFVEMCKQVGDKFEATQKGVANNAAILERVSESCRRISDSQQNIAKALESACKAECPDHNQRRNNKP